ncbi:MAG: hypothetical protein KUG71_12500 [Porticoccaceae bacterium]|nr:hypothetical protein [Porticoccaceae bacterium]
MNQHRLEKLLSGIRSPRTRCALASLTLAASTVFYIPVSSAALFDELSKNELSEIRGKFLRSGNILQYFGLSMNTTWGTPSGSAHSSGLNLGFHLGGNSPTISITRSGSVGDRVDGAAVIQPDTGLQQISGSVQSIQVGGNSNTLGNQLDLDVNGTNTAVASSSDPDLGTGVETYKSSDGVVTQFVNTDNTIGYSMQNNTGTVTQRLGANSFNKHQLLQSIKVAGNMQHIVNTIGLDVRLNDRARLRQTALGFTGNSALIGLR